MAIYCTYLTTYFGSKLPPFYIGSSSVNKINSGYHGSILSKKYKIIYNDELKKNPELFKTKIIKTFNTRTEATQSEYKLQRQLNVVKSEMYFNESFASPNGYFGRDVSGKNHPMYGKTHSIETRKRLADHARSQFTGITLSLRHKQKIGKAQKGHIRHHGQGNPTFDANNYKFYNERTNESFEGTRYDFLKIYPVSKSNLSSVISGKTRQTKGWIIV